jgi:hypothetical protein
MTKLQPDQCRSTLRQNIPWYLNGTLSDPDVALLKAHIESCADCRADVELHASMQAAVLDRDVTSIMPKAKAADIIGITRTGSARETQNRRTSSRLFALAAGVAIIGVSLIVWFSSDQGNESGNQQFETATSQGPVSGIDYVLEMRFDDEVSDQQRNEIVDQLEGVAKWSRSNNGVYEIHVQLSTPSLATLEQYALHANSIPGVQSAEFTALQLPMR